MTDNPVVWLMVGLPFGILVVFLVLGWLYGEQ